MSTDDTDDTLLPVKSYLTNQVNEFECRKCKAHISLESVPIVPVFPCQVCETVNWEIYSINGTIIYPHRS